MSNIEDVVNSEKQRADTTFGRLQKVQRKWAHEVRRATAAEDKLKRANHRIKELQTESDRVWAYLQSLEDMAADHPQDYYANEHARQLRAALEDV